MNFWLHHHQDLKITQLIPQPKSIFNKCIKRGQYTDFMLSIDLVKVGDGGA